jgi:hypothetical protein
MDKLTIKYHASSKALAPQPIRIKAPGWGGTAEKMQDGAVAQPWHCLPFVEGSIYGLELLYQYDAECRVSCSDSGLHFDWNFAGEKNPALNGNEFVELEAKSPWRYYQLKTGLDIKAPPGHVIRIEPHARFFTDDTGTAPLATIGHVAPDEDGQHLTVAFRGPEPGQQHIFHKGEPYAQILFVPEQVSYELTKMSAKDEARRRELERQIEEARFAIADNVWQNSDGPQQDNHYKILARAFARDGLAGVDEVVQQASLRREQKLSDQTIAQCLAQAAQLMKESKRREASTIYLHVLNQDPDNAEALNNMGICQACAGNVSAGLEMMGRALALQPMIPR